MLSSAAAGATLFKARPYCKVKMPSVPNVALVISFVSKLKALLLFVPKLISDTGLLPPNKATLGPSADEISFQSVPLPVVINSSPFAPALLFES